MCHAGAINELKIEKEIYSIEKCWCGLSVKNELELGAVASMLHRLDAVFMITRAPTRPFRDGVVPAQVDHRT